MDKGFAYNGRHLPYNPKLIERAKKLRKSPTAAEEKLWKEFLQTFKPRFRRQRPIDHFIADFYCAAVRLVVELDGAGHAEPKNMQNDAARTAMINSYDIELLRFSNSQVIDDFDSVCSLINMKVASRLSLPPIRGDRGGSEIKP